MTGYITTCTGEVWQLPALKAWQVTHTDGSACSCAEAEFLLEPKRLPQLEQAVRLRLEEKGRTVFFGVVDEMTAKCGKEGHLASLSCRGMQALLMDNELCATEFSRLSFADAMAKFVTPFGVELGESRPLPTVTNFSVETAMTPWQALRGYCRHAAQLFPRVSRGGKLLLSAESGLHRRLSKESGVVEAELCLCRYGLISRQLIVTAGKQTVEEERDEALAAFGVSTQKVTMKQGKTLKADWRTARQRMEDAGRQGKLLAVTLSGYQEAEPGDTITADLEKLGVKEDFTVQSVCHRGDASGTYTKIIMEGAVV